MLNCLSSSVSKAMKSAPPESQASSMHTYTTIVTVSHYDIPRYIVTYIQFYSDVVFSYSTLFYDIIFMRPLVGCEGTAVSNKLYSKYLRKKSC